MAARGDLLDQFLGAAIEQLDISPVDTSRALKRYRNLAAFVKRYWAVNSASHGIYLHGSLRLGTVTRIIHRNDEYDVDAVFRLDLARSSAISQGELKREVGRVLDEFVKSRPRGYPWLDEGRRSWTLRYPRQPWAPRQPNRRFHLVVIPALRDPAAPSEAGLLLADRLLVRWHRSMPLDYADWFYDRMRETSPDRHTVKLLVDDVAVYGVPRRAARTSLQRAVQALKRHRDKYFAQDLQNRPGSILLTTLAARAYSGNRSLFDELRDIVDGIPSSIPRENGVLMVANPVRRDENLVDYWREHPLRALRFFEWVTQAKADLAEVGRSRSMDDLFRAVARAFGERPAQHAARTVEPGRRRLEPRTTEPRRLNGSRSTTRLQLPAARPDTAVREAPVDRGETGGKRDEQATDEQAVQQHAGVAVVADVEGGVEADDRAAQQGEAEPGQREDQREQDDPDPAAVAGAEDGPAEHGGGGERQEVGDGDVADDGQRDGDDGVEVEPPHDGEVAVRPHGEQ
jgi:hypothetical protein